MFNWSSIQIAITYTRRIKKDSSQKLNWCQPQQRWRQVWMMASVNPADATWKYPLLATVPLIHGIIHICTYVQHRSFSWIHPPIKGYSTEWVWLGWNQKYRYESEDLKWSSNKSRAIRCFVLNNSGFFFLFLLFIQRIFTDGLEFFFSVFFSLFSFIALLSIPPRWLNAIWIGRCWRHYKIGRPLQNSNLAPNRLPNRTSQSIMWWIYTHSDGFLSFSKIYAFGKWEEQ